MKFALAMADTTFESANNTNNNFGDSYVLPNFKSPNNVPSNVTQIVQNALNELRISKQQNIRAEIYCPNRKDEILLAESAQTLAVRCLLGMVGTFKTKIISCSNSFDMTQNGYVPVVRIVPNENFLKIVPDGLILANFESVVAWCKSRCTAINEELIKEHDQKSIENQNIFNSGSDLQKQALELEQNKTESILQTSALNDLIQSSNNDTILGSDIEFF